MAEITFTSPPYAEQRKKQYGGVPAEKYIAWFEKVQKQIKKILTADGSFFLNIKPHTNEGERELYVSKLVLQLASELGWKFIDEFCWLNCGIPGRFPNRFKNGFEPVFHFARQSKIKFRPENVAGDPSFGNDHSKPSNSGSGVRGGDYSSDAVLPSNVLKIANRDVQAHPAIFPVGLPAFFISAFTDESDSVFDPFLGSGTTLIACEQLGRVCYGCEISPGYVAVILQRYQDATGKEPKLIGA